MSVLVPARNAQATIEPALRSVFAQRFADWELLVVDDGSADATPRILERFSAREPRLRVLSTAPYGIVPALNAGLAACRAPLIARFDADDLMHRDRLATQLRVLADHPQLAGVGSRVRCFPRPPLRDGMRRYETWLNEVLSPEALRAQRFVEAPLVHPSVTLRRDALERIGGWRDVAWPEDWDVWLRLFEAGCALGKCPETLHFWRDRPERLTRTDARYALEAHVRARVHFLVRGPLRDRVAIVWGAGPVGKALVRGLLAAGARLEAFVDVDPRKIGQRVYGLPVLGPAALGAPNGRLLLAAVGAAGARGEIRTEAQARGFVEGSDFFACA